MVLQGSSKSHDASSLPVPEIYHFLPYAAICPVKIIKKRERDRERDEKKKRKKNCGEVPLFSNQKSNDGIFRMLGWNVFSETSI